MFIVMGLRYEDYGKRLTNVELHGICFQRKNALLRESEVIEDLKKSDMRPTTWASLENVPKIAHCISARGALLNDGIIYMLYVLEKEHDDRIGHLVVQQFSGLVEAVYTDANIAAEEYSVIDNEDEHDDARCEEYQRITGLLGSGAYKNVEDYERKK